MYIYMLVCVYLAICTYVYVRSPGFQLYVYLYYLYINANMYVQWV